MIDTLMFVEIGDTVETIKPINKNYIYIENGEASAEKGEFDCGTRGLVQVIDSNEKVVIRVPIQRKNAYCLVSVEREAYKIHEKRTTRDDEDWND